MCSFSRTVPVDTLLVLPNMLSKAFINFSGSTITRPIPHSKCVGHDGTTSGPVYNTSNKPLLITTTGGISLEHYYPR
ncbi:hypothetical protein ANN_01168 [Periplaneta americana]|uniref:Per a allergen n=1 Tax=Periplaneta americana TaxID=6978 RepID=A0ABQ8TW70_PERAM|nr:hypothetical protein ANN_01168 [Periplaneta americana]